MIVCGLGDVGIEVFWWNSDVSVVYVVGGVFGWDWGVIGGVVGVVLIVYVFWGGVCVG